MGMALLAGCGNGSDTEGQDLATLRSVTAPFKAGTMAPVGALGT
jgi:hypothetical protein